MLETEVHRVLHLLEDIGNITTTGITQWICDMTARIDIWYKKAQTYALYGLHEFCGVNNFHLIMRLHRPTPRIRIRSIEDRRICLDACKIVIEHYLEKEKQRRLFYPWHGVQILFEVAVVSMDACWCSREWSSLRPQTTEMLGVLLPQCLQLISSIGGRWSEAKICADHLHELLPRVSGAFLDADCGVRIGQHETADDALVVEELRGLLFSDGPLTWNTAPQETLPADSGNVQVPESLLDMDTFRWEWGTELDLQPTSSHTTQWH